MKSIILCLVFISSIVQAEPSSNSLTEKQVMAAIENPENLNGQLFKDVLKKLSKGKFDKSLEVSEKNSAGNYVATIEFLPSQLGTKEGVVLSAEIRLNQGKAYVFSFTSERTVLLVH